MRAKKEKSQKDQKDMITRVPPNRFLFYHLTISIPRFADITSRLSHIIQNGCSEDHQG